MLHVPKRDRQFHGLLVVDKPGLPLPGSDASEEKDTQPASSTLLPPARLPTSHDVVQMVRRWSGERQIGHTGTLDPMASGVLVLCLGQATRLVEYYQGHAKQYYAEVRLGQATDSYDATGALGATAPVPPLTIPQIEAALQQFRGAIQQLPPVYSALKQGGESLHHKARRGETVTLTPRPVTFYQLDLVAYHAPDRLCLRARCSAGTYMRSLAYDLGLALHTVAHLSVLRREQAGPFTLAMAHPLDEIEKMAQQERLTEWLLPLGVGLELPTIQLDDEQIRRLGHGQKVCLPLVAGVAARPDQLAAGYQANGQCLGILRCLEATQQDFVWKAEKWFGPNSQ